MREMCCEVTSNASTRSCCLRSRLRACSVSGNRSSSDTDRPSASRRRAQGVACEAPGAAELPRTLAVTCLAGKTTTYKPRWPPCLAGDTRSRRGGAGPAAPLHRQERTGLLDSASRRHRPCPVSASQEVRPYELGAYASWQTRRLVCPDAISPELGGRVRATKKTCICRLFV